MGRCYMQSLGMRREGGPFWRDLKSWVGAKLLKAAVMAGLGQDALAICRQCGGCPVRSPSLPPRFLGRSPAPDLSEPHAAQVSPQ